MEFTMAHTNPQKQTTLLDLPNELIDQILAEIKWGAPAPTFPLDGLQFYENLAREGTDPEAATIPHVRLTCRRLAARASPLLLPVASVSVSDPASVDRLELIASHAAFARHVRAVRVCFGFYEAELAADVRKLAAHLVWCGRTRLLLQNGQVSSAGAESDTALLLTTTLPGGKTRDEWGRVFDDWDDFCHDADMKGEWNGDGLEGYLTSYGLEETESMRLLRREHAEYRRRYEAQQRLRQSVVERIAGAMARMPRATRLVLDDGPDAPPKGTWLAAPTTWATAFKFGRGSPPIETLFALPAAVHRAGVELTALRIRQLRLPAEFPLWLGPDGEEEDDGLSPFSGFGGFSWATGGEDPPPPGEGREAGELRAACASLRVFEFTPGYEPGCWPTDSPTHLEWPGMSRWPGPRTLLDDVLRWMILPSATLEQVRVDLQMVHGGTPWELAMPVPPPWARIRVLHLQDGWLDVATLTSFLSATAGTLARLHLDGMHLCCSQFEGPWPGVQAPYSWASVLDLLRLHCCGRPGEEPSGSVAAPAGDDSSATERPVGTRAAAAQQEAPMTVVRLRRPGGAEFEDRSLSKADMAHIRALFEPDDDDVGRRSGLSAVDRFIQGLGDRNPLVAAGKTPLLYP